MKFEILNNDTFILKPNTDFEIKIKLNDINELTIFYKLIDYNKFNDDGSNAIILKGEYVISKLIPQVALRAPKNIGDYRLWFSEDKEFNASKNVRIIVSDNIVETAPDISLFKEEITLISGIFYFYDKVIVKKLLFNKSNEYKTFYCEAFKIVNNEKIASAFIIKLGFKYFLKLDLVGINKLTSKGVALNSDILDFIFKDDFGILLFKFIENLPLGKCQNIIEYIESHNENEISVVIKNFLYDLCNRFYIDYTVLNNLLVLEYDSLFFGMYVFGLFSFIPHITIEGGDLSKPLKIEGENRSFVFEVYKFNAIIEKVYDRAFVIKVKDEGTFFNQSCYIYNPAIKKERLAKLINSLEYKIELKSSKPLLLEEFYQKIITEVFAENRELLGIIKNNDIINFLKVLKKERYSYKVSLSVGTLNPREMYLSNKNTILLTSFDNISDKRHVLFDLALFETSLKIYGLYPLMIKNGLLPKFSDVFEDTLDGLQNIIPNECLKPYRSAILAIREVAKKYLNNPNDTLEYYVALFLTELGLLKNFYTNAKSKVAQFIFRSLDKRAKFILSGTYKVVTFEIASNLKQVTTSFKSNQISSNLKSNQSAQINLANYQLILTCLNGPYKDNIFEIKYGTTIIGRSRQCDICLRDCQYVSSKHIAIEFSEISLKIRDLSSTNGTFVNGDKINEKIITDNCILRLGDIEFKLEFKFKSNK